MDRIKEKERSGLPLWLLMTAALAFLSAHVVILALIIPLALAYMTARFGVLGCIAGIIALSAAALKSPWAAAAFAAAFLPMSLASVMALRQNRRFYDSVLLVSFAALAGAALCIGLLWLVTGASPAEYAARRGAVFFETLSDGEVSLLYQGVRFADVQSGAITQQAVIATPRAEAVETMTGMLRETVGYSLVPMLLVYSLLWGLLCYLLPHRYMSRHGMMVKAVPAFSDYELPQRLWAAFLLSYLGAALGSAFSWPRFDLLTEVIYTAYAFVFTVQALSFLDFFYRKRGMRTAARVAFHIVAIIIFGYTLMWVGIFENVIRYRRRSEEKGGEEF